MSFHVFPLVLVSFLYFILCLSCIISGVCSCIIIVFASLEMFSCISLVLSLVLVIVVFLYSLCRVELSCNLLSYFLLFVYSLLLVDCHSLAFPFVLARISYFRLCSRSYSCRILIVTILLLMQATHSGTCPSQMHCSALCLAFSLSSDRSD